MGTTATDSERLPGGLPRWLEAPVAALLLVALAPLLLLLAVAILITSGLPALFRQERIGRHGRPFTLLKLRTMTVERHGPRVTARRDQRVTRLGRLLRRLKLDELPELLHVVRGEMAFVGPRPEVPHFVQPDDPAWKAVLAVRPGLTDPMTLSLYDEEGLLAAAAAKGADIESFYRDRLLPHKLSGYRRYLEERSWRSDLRVIGATILAILGHSRARGEPAKLDDIKDADFHA